MKQLSRIITLVLISILILNVLTVLPMSASNTGTRGSAPVLVNAGVTPSSGNTSTLFNFTVTYKDADGDVPWSVEVYIDGSNHNMTGIGSNATFGITFYYATTLSAGNHSYYFYAMNNLREIAIDPKNTTYALFVSSGSGSGNKPQLLNSQYLPSRPIANQTINFTVWYKDIDNDAPNFVNLEITPNINGTKYNWTIYNMTVTGTAYSTGVVCYKNIILSAGYYLFKYKASKLKSVIVTTTNYNLYVAPNSSSQSKLFNGMVTPPNGTNQTSFTFSVYYQDNNNNFAIYSHVIIDNNLYKMYSGIGDPGMAGRYYYYSTTLDVGNHTYRFEFSDGNTNVSLPQSGTFIGPYVTSSGSNTNRAPTAKISVTPIIGNINTTFYFNGTGTDPDGDNLTYSWSFNDINTIYWQKNVVRKYTRAGNYSATFTVSDGSLKDSVTAKVIVTSSTNPPPKNNPPVIKVNINMTNYIKLNTTKYISALKSYDPDNDKLTFNWSVISANSKNPALYNVAAFNYTFNMLGNYTFRLTVSDGKINSNGLYTFFCGKTNIPPRNKSPVAKASVTVSKMTAKLSGSGSYDPDGNIVSYIWKIGNISYKGMYYNHTYKTIGYKTAGLTVTDNGGLTNQAVIGFYITNRTNGSNPPRVNYNNTMLGTHVNVKDNLGEIGLDVINSESSFMVILLESKRNYFKFSISSDSEEGRLIVIDIENDIFDFSKPDLIELTMDYLDVQTTNFEKIIETPGYEPVYHIIDGEYKSQLLVYIPHFSEHILELKLKDDPSDPDPPVDNYFGTETSLWPVLLIVIVVIIIVIVLTFQEIRKKKDREFYHDFRVAENQNLNGVQAKTETESEKDEDSWDDLI
jgi:PKD repeat protein